MTASQKEDREASGGWQVEDAVYNFCRVHAPLQGTPAMAADLTARVWSVDEVLRHRIKRE